jgi:FMN-dependent NADH-azoreductase
LQQANTILIASPIYSFQIPAALKAWIDLVARAKETFKYTENGPVGLLTGKQAILVITSGGTKLGSDIDFVSSYLRHVLAFIGINDLTIIDGSGLGRDEENIINNARQEIDALALLS